MSDADAIWTVIYGSLVIYIPVVLLKVILKILSH